MKRINRMGQKKIARIVAVVGLLISCNMEAVAAVPVGGGQNRPAPAIAPHDVMIACETAGLIWWAIVSLVVLAVHARRDGARVLNRAPRCAMGAVLGASAVVVGIAVGDDWFVTFGVANLTASHLCESTSTAGKHIWPVEVATTGEELCSPVVFNKTNLEPETEAQPSKQPKPEQPA